jgi:hypothetical protein
MSKHGEYLYGIVGTKRDGSEASFDIYKVGGSLRIVPRDGGEPKLVGKGRTLDGELRIVYDVVEHHDDRF